MRRTNISEPPRIGELLVERGLVTWVQLEQALGERRVTGEQTGEALVRLGYLGRRQLAVALGEQSLRRFLGAIGMTVVALHPSLAAAGSVRNQLGVSATVATSASADARLVGRSSAGSAEAGTASVVLACRGRVPVNIDVEWGRYIAGGHGGAPAYVPSWKVGPTQAATCEVIPRKLWADLTARSPRKKGPPTDDLVTVNIVITY